MKHELCPLCAPQPVIDSEDVKLPVTEIGIIRWIEDEGFEGEGFCTKCGSVRKCGVCGKIMEARKVLSMVSPKEQYICVQCYHKGVISHSTKVHQQ